MGAKTEISWTDSTWSPIRARVRQDAARIAREKGYESLVPIAAKMAGRVGQHCEHVSAGCEHCYAESNNHRCLPGNGTGLPYDRRSRDLVETYIDDKVLMQPLKWGACHWYDPDDGMVMGERPRKIFVQNQSDLFAEWVTDEMRDRVFAVMALTPQHIFQVLTKRPGEMWRYLRPDCPLPNIWLGVSAEDQAAADKRREPMEKLAAMGWTTFVSSEPRLGPIDWAGWEFIKQLISGGESGRGARAAHPQWFRDDRDWCYARKVAFFFKQWGEWLPTNQFTGKQKSLRERAHGLLSLRGHLSAHAGHDRPCPELGLSTRDLDSNDGVAAVYKVGKKAAGALLDGREWKEFPR